MQAGAESVKAVDIDSRAIAAISLNAKANDVRLDTMQADLLDEEPPTEVDVILAGDCWYEREFGERTTAWLQQAHAAGIDVLIGDPGRRYLDRAAVRELAEYEVRSTTELEDLGRTTAFVYEITSTPAGAHAALR
jgi:predicted nicotinamide N-methyase